MKPILFGTPIGLALLAAACGGSDEGPAPTTTERGNADLARAVVQILAEDQGEALWSGSGTLISAEGLVLTNAHVAADMFDELPDVEFPELTVAILNRTDEPPEPSHRAEVKSIDYALDLAVISVVSDLAGDAPDTTFPFVEIGDSEAVEIGDGIRILGYPGIGGETITFTDGVVSGFTSERSIGNRAWIKTDATVAHGNSGGMAANEAGFLIGVPTIGGSSAEAEQIVDCELVADTNRDGEVNENDTCVSTSGFINGLRPANLARPLLEAALSGEEYVSEYEQPDLEAAAEFNLEDALFSEIVFADGATEDDEPSQTYEAYPSGEDEICAFWDFEGMTDGVTWEALWFIDGELNEDVSFFDETWDVGETGAMWICASQEAELSDGLYELALSVEGEFMGSGTIFVGGDHPSVPFTIRNESSADICYVFMSPTGAQNWGFDRLGIDAGIAAGGEAEFDLPAASYDLLVEDCEEKQLAEEYEIDIAEVSSYSATD